MDSSLSVVVVLLPHARRPGYCPRLTDKGFEAVGHGVSQVRLPAQIRPVSVEHEAIQLQLL